MKVWLIQPGVAPYRIPLFTLISQEKDIDLEVVLLCEQVPFQRWEIDRKELPFKTTLVKGINLEVNDDRLVHDREVQFSFPIIWKIFRDRPDVIVCSGFMLSTFLVFLTTRLTRTPYLIWNEGTKYTDGDLPKTKYFLRKIMARYSKNFVVAGTLAQDYVQNLLPNNSGKIFYLSYNCVDNEHFREDIFEERLTRLKHRLPERYFLFVGRLIETKGIKEMMHAYRDLIARPGMEDVGLVLLGEGRLKEYVKTFIAEYDLSNVFLEGFVEQDRIQYFYAGASGFVLLSLSDPNPLVIFEAMAAGIPIVCSKRAGNAADFVVNGKNGFQVDPFDHSDVVNRLAESLTNIDIDIVRNVSSDFLRKANYDSASASFTSAIRDAARR